MLIQDLGAGRSGAAEKLAPVVYGELRALAGALMRDERAEHTLQPTALVHEAFVRLAGGGTLSAADRGHFMALAAKVMRQVLIDHARAKRTAKRGGAAPAHAEAQRVLALHGLTPEGSSGAGLPRVLDVLDLHDAMEALAKQYPRAARVVELRFFGGMNAAEVAALLQVAVPTVERDWALARGWLLRHLEGPGANAPTPAREEQ